MSARPAPFGVRDAAERRRARAPASRTAAPARAGARPHAGSSAWSSCFALAYITLNTLRTDAPGSRGLDAGEPLPPFAAPLALSRLEGDANVATKPARGGQGERPACEVRGPDVLNSCELAERGPVALAFVAARSERCDRQIDALERVRARLPGRPVRRGRDPRRPRRPAALVRERGWTLPVA